MASDRTWCSSSEQRLRVYYSDYVRLVIAACLALLCAAASAHAQTIAGTSVYVRTDTDKTTVIAPRLHVGAPVNDTTRVDLVYTADVWTSASIDIRTSASKAVTEQRDEINATVTKEWNDLTLSGTYRYSHEYDYESHGGMLNGAYSFAEKSATLDFRLAATFDDVGRAGYRNFNRNVTNLGARVGFTQLLDSQTYIQGLYELMSANGFNSSAYRYIGLGGLGGLCKGGVEVAYCPAENNPGERLRHAVGVNFRRALSDALSFGVQYRFYLDSWDVTSHTGTLELNYSPEHDWLLTLRYRFYMQGAASHYKRIFSTSDLNAGFFSNDKELSQFMSHRVALDIEKVFELDLRHELSVIASFAPSFFMYDNYAPLSSITAYEMTLATVLKL